MMKRKILFIFILLFVVTATAIITHVVSIRYYINHGQYYVDARSVRELPNLYIPLDTLPRATEIRRRDSKSNNDLEWIILYSTLYFMDSDNIEIFSTHLSNSSLIIKYKDEYYISERVYNPVVYNANVIAEQRNRLYNIGDAVILRGHEVIPYIIIIDSCKTSAASSLDPLFFITCSSTMP